MHKAVSLAGENLSYAVESRRNRANSMIDREVAWCLLTEFTLRCREQASYRFIKCERHRKLQSGSAKLAQESCGREWQE